MNKLCFFVALELFFCFLKFFPRSFLFLSLVSIMLPWRKVYSCQCSSVCVEKLLHISFLSLIWKSFYLCLHGPCELFHHSPTFTFMKISCSNFFGSEQFSHNKMAWIEHFAFFWENNICLFIFLSEFFTLTCFLIIGHTFKLDYLTDSKKLN